VDAIPTPLTVHLSHFPQISLPLGRLHLAPLTDYGKCTSNRSSEIGEIRRALHAKRFANVKQFLYIFGNHPAPLRKYRSKGMGSFEGLILSFRVCYYWIFLVLVIFFVVVLVLNQELLLRTKWHRRKRVERPKGQNQRGDHAQKKSFVVFDS